MPKTNEKCAHLTTTVNYEMIEIADFQKWQQCGHCVGDKMSHEYGQPPPTTTKIMTESQTTHAPHMTPQFKIAELVSLFHMCVRTPFTICGRSVYFFHFVNFLIF